MTRRAADSGQYDSPAVERIVILGLNSPVSASLSGKSFVYNCWYLREEGNSFIDVELITLGRGGG